MTELVSNCWVTQMELAMMLVVRRCRTYFNPTNRNRIKHQNIIWRRSEICDAILTIYTSVVFLYDFRFLLFCHKLAGKTSKRNCTLCFLYTLPTILTRTSGKVQWNYSFQRSKIVDIETRIPHSLARYCFLHSREQKYKKRNVYASQ